MLNNFIEWWNSPIKPKDKVHAVLIGGIGSFWVGVLGLLIFSPSPVSLSFIAYWALGSVIVGIILGLLFPKVVTVILFPFSMFSIGGS